MTSPAAPDSALPPSRREGVARLPGLYMELTKARLSGLVLVTALVGFLLASPRPLDPVLLFWTLLGTALSAAGANALNQWMEVRLDARMERTRERPLPSGRLSATHALLLALGLAGGGVAVLAVFVNGLSAALAAFVVLLYLLAYTPLKRRSPACTLVGAVCGAIPPMIGWAGASGGLDTGAWLLGAILFVWQIPHFLALAWLYRDDYEKGGFRMLPVIDRAGRLTTLMVLLYSLALLPVGLTSTLLGITGRVFPAISLLLGGLLLTTGLMLHRSRSASNARRVFLASIIYLPVLLAFMVVDREAPRVPAAGAAVAVVQPAAKGGL